MALHRGRIDLLEKHLLRDPSLLQRTFTHEEIYPPEFGCHTEVLATQGTPLTGATLLHMCVDYDEMEIARWLLERGMDVDARAAVDSDGFGGHTALFATVVSQPNFWMNYGGKPQVAPLTELLLDPRWNGGADPNARASLRKQLHPGYAPKYDVETLYEYRDVTPLSWGNAGVHLQILDHTIADVEFPLVIQLRRLIAEGGVGGGNGRIVGVVRDAITRQPLANAVVAVFRDGNLIDSVLTDTGGDFGLPALVGAVYRFNISRSGYLPVTYNNVTVLPNETKTLDVILQIDDAHQAWGMFRVLFSMQFLAPAFKD